MAFQNWRSYLSVLCFLILAAPLVQCTSSEDEDVSVLDQELENIEGTDFDEMGSDDLGEFADDELSDIGDESEGLLDDELDDIDGGFADESDEEMFAENDEEFSDSEFSEDEFAELDQENFDEFSEFENVDEAGASKSEESLAQELEQGTEYPINMDQEPTFPEEVMASADANGAPMAVNPTSDAVMGGAATGAVITSETQEITAVPPDENGLPKEDLGKPDPINPEEEDDDVSWVPVVKVKSDPFFRNERLMNAVYIARPDEDLSKISDKIFGNDKSGDLLKDNPHLGKGVDPGDKVYYNSPNRSADNSELKIYYEDIGLPPQYYTTENNDNMRRLGSKLLGFSEGWKEIWAINPQVDSKTVLQAGMKLKYWTGNEERPNLQMAANTPDATQSVSEPVMDEAASMGQVQDIGADDPFASELPPEPPLPEPQLAMPQDSFESEPQIEAFPDEGIETTPSPVPVAQVAQTSDDSLLTVGVVALLMIAGVALMAIQIKKRKDATGLNPQSLEYTQA